MFTSPSNPSTPPFMPAGGETAGLRSPSAASAQTLDVFHLDAARLASVRLAGFGDYSRNVSKGGKEEEEGKRRSRGSEGQEVSVRGAATRGRSGTCHRIDPAGSCELFYAFECGKMSQSCVNSHKKS